MEERLKELITTYGSDEFTAVFLQWLDSHDDTDITCMSDVVSTLTDELEEDISRGFD